MPDVRPPLCLYHKNCLDGSGSAAVVMLREPACVCMPAQYGDPPPARELIEGRRVYVVDFGLPIEQMRFLRAQADEVIWLDHHSSQLDMQRTLNWGILDPTECGTSLCWRELFPGRPPPPVVPYIKDKDLWRWELPDSRAIAAGLEATFKGSKFAGLLDVDLAEMARLGRPLLAALAERVTIAAAAGVPLEDAYGLPGVRALAVTCKQDQNEMGEHICRPLAEGGLGYDLAILYYLQRPGVWIHSLRSTRIDCGAIAAKRGGGGHPSSAAYRADRPIVPPPGPSPAPPTVA